MPCACGTCAARTPAGVSASTAAAHEPSPYSLAADTPGSQLPAVFGRAGRLAGGACRAAGNNGALEAVEKLFDGGCLEGITVCAMRVSHLKSRWRDNGSYVSHHTYGKCCSPRR